MTSQPLPLRNKDVEASLDVGIKIHATPNDCFANACRAIQTIPELAEAVYVEGMGVVVDTIEPFEHGWIFHNGNIIDPTLAREHVWYLPAIEFAGSSGIQEFIEAEGFSDPPFHKAPQFKARFSRCYNRSVAFRKTGIHDVLSFDEFIRQAAENAFITVSKPIHRE